MTWEQERGNKQKLIKFTILKYKTFVAKDTINKVKRQAKNERNIFPTYILFELCCCCFFLSVSIDYFTN